MEEGKSWHPAIYVSTRNTTSESGLNRGGVVEISPSTHNPEHARELFRTFAASRIPDIGGGERGDDPDRASAAIGGQRKKFACVIDGVRLGSFGDTVLDALVAGKGQEICRARKFAVRPPGLQMERVADLSGNHTAQSAVYVFCGGHRSPSSVARREARRGFKVKVIDDRTRAFWQHRTPPRRDANM